MAYSFRSNDVLVLYFLKINVQYVVTPRSAVWRRESRPGDVREDYFGNRRIRFIGPGAIASGQIMDLQVVFGVSRCSFPVDFVSSEEVEVEELTS
jgi:hypothetical protein